MDSLIPLRVADEPTLALYAAVSNFFDVQRVRLGIEQRTGDKSPALLKEEQRLDRIVKRTLARHLLWPWLSQFPGLGGARVALLVSRIGQPHLFPGQRCSEGHYMPPVFDLGVPCPFNKIGATVGRREDDGFIGGADTSSKTGATDSTSENQTTRGGAGISSKTGAAGGHAASEMRAGRASKTGGVDTEGESDERHGPPASSGTAELNFESDADGGCPGFMLAPRPHTGTRSLYHYAGIHVGDDGRIPRKKKGQRIDWRPELRTAFLAKSGPIYDLGICGQIVKHKPPIYHPAFVAAKERLARRGAASNNANESESGPSAGEEQTEPNAENELRNGLLLAPYQIHNTAALIAAKQFAGDLLAEWKQLIPLGELRKAAA